MKNKWEIIEIMEKVGGNKIIFNFLVWEIYYVKGGKLEKYEKGKRFCFCFMYFFLSEWVII